MKALSTAVLYFLSSHLFIYYTSEASVIQESPEQLFNQAVEKWYSSGKQNYESFDTLSEQLSERFNNLDPISNKRLEVIGAMEESILIIERFIFQEQQGRDDPIRDATLSEFYTIYAMALSELTSKECHSLALDPHTLLIGADTITVSSEPSTELCMENADNSIRNAATLDATNQKAEAFLTKLNSGSVHKRKPTEFVAELFDSFADTFDEKLLKNLEYRVPELVGDLVQKTVTSLSQATAMEFKFQNALDAGCGTGLAGRYLRPFVNDLLIGVDASQKMLDIAKSCTKTKGCGLENYVLTNDGDDDRPLYDNLLAMDLEDMTIANTLPMNESYLKNGFDLIVAADVLVYFGSLDSIFQTFANISSLQSILIFSCEKASTDEAPLGFRLLPSGRFSHTKDHALQMAEKVGFELIDYQDIVPRMEKGEPVKGHLFAFQLKGEKNEEDVLSEEL